jgi:hypothetical protein
MHMLVTYCYALYGFLFFRWKTIIWKSSFVQRLLYFIGFWIENNSYHLHLNNHLLEWWHFYWRLEYHDSPFHSMFNKKFQPFVKNVYHSYHWYSLNLVFNCCVILLLALREIFWYIYHPTPTPLSRPCCVRGKKRQPNNSIPV